MGTKKATDKTTKKSIGISSLEINPEEEIPFKITTFSLMQMKCVAAFQ
jgi:hypothetical protein